MRSTTKERAGVLASIVAACAASAGAVVALGGCPLKNCDGSWVFLGNTPDAAPPEGTTYGAELPFEHAVDETTWESVPIDGTYLDFPGQRVYVFAPFLDKTPSGQPFTGPYTNIVAYVSADPQPSLNGSNFTIASGNLAEVVGVTTGGFAVHNDTCAEYYLRVVATRAAPDGGAPAPPPVDASADAAAGMGDGGGDGGDLDAADAGGS
jgi:hypothetical protein